MLRLSNSASSQWYTAPTERTGEGRQRAGRRWRGSGGHERTDVKDSSTCKRSFSGNLSPLPHGFPSFGPPLSPRPSFSPPASPISPWARRKATPENPQSRRHKLCGARSSHHVSDILRTKYHIELGRNSALDYLVDLVQTPSPHSKRVRCPVKLPMTCVA